VTKVSAKAIYVWKSLEIQSVRLTFAVASCIIFRNRLMKTFINVLDLRAFKTSNMVTYICQRFNNM